MFSYEIYVFGRAFAQSVWAGAVGDHPAGVHGVPPQGVHEGVHGGGHHPLPLHLRHREQPEEHQVGKRI